MLREQGDIAVTTSSCSSLKLGNNYFMKMRVLGFFFVTVCVLSGPAIAQQALSPECGNLRNAYGPYDYRNSIGTDRLNVVEAFHFDSNVENLRKVPGQVGGEISYTLRAFPNHHRALLSMVRLGSNLKMSKPPGAAYTVGCFLMRAEVFQPEDAMVKVIYGHYLLKQGQRAQAFEKLGFADMSESKDANVAYNLGLAYFEAGDFGKALDNAHVAYRLGFPLPGLRDKLKRAGKWKEVPIVSVTTEKATPQEALAAPLPAPTGPEPEASDKTN